MAGRELRGDSIRSHASYRSGARTRATRYTLASRQCSIVSAASESSGGVVDVSNTEQVRPGVDRHIVMPYVPSTRDHALNAMRWDDHEVDLTPAIMLLSNYIATPSQNRLLFIQLHSDYIVTCVWC